MVRAVNQNTAVTEISASYSSVKKQIFQSQSYIPVYCFLVFTYFFVLFCFCFFFATSSYSLILFLGAGSEQTEQGAKDELSEHK